MRRLIDRICYAPADDSGGGGNPPDDTTTDQIEEVEEWRQEVENLRTQLTTAQADQASKAEITELRQSLSEAMLQLSEAKAALATLQEAERTRSQQPEPDNRNAGDDPPVQKTKRTGRKPERWV